MNPILQPGAMLLNKLNFRGKFVLIGSIMFGVIALITLALVTSLMRDIQTVHMQQRGMEVIQKVVPVLIEVQKHRGLNSAYLGGDVSAMAKLQAINAKQDELIAAIAKDGGIEAFKLSQHWEVLKTQWIDVRDHSSGYSKAQSFQEHTKLVAALHAFVIQIADAAGVTLGSELDSFYLQDTALNKLIGLSESIGKLRAKGAGLLAAKASTPEERAEIMMLVASISDFEQVVRQNLAKVTASNPGLEASLSTQEIVNSINELHRTVNSEVLSETPTLEASAYFAQATSVIDGVMELYAKTDEALITILSVSESRLKKQLVIYFGGILLVVIFSIYCFIAMTASISQAVKEIDAAIDDFSQGDLTRRVEHDADDELGNIGRRFNSAGERLRAVMVNVEKSAMQVFTAAAALQNASRQIASDSENESESVQATAAAIEEITVSITHVADSSTEASNAAAEGVKVSEAGEHTVHQAAKEMKSIAMSVGESAALIEGLNERARQISSIVGVISDIADQTNLLALNAAIEAARAGEQGRGFAVVADEVRKLAERTGNATGEITAMITDIQRETANAVSSMNTGSKQAERGVELAEQAALSLAQVNSGSHDVRARIEEIADAIREQSAATTDIAQNLERISVMSENTNLEVQNAISAINSLEQQAEALRNQVMIFKV